jgi:hypothetical protein
VNLPSLEVEIVALKSHQFSGAKSGHCGNCEHRAIAIAPYYLLDYERFRPRDRSWTSRNLLIHKHKKYFTA